MSLYTNARTATSGETYTQIVLPKEGDYIYAKQGLKVGYYTDSTAKNAVGPSGGSGGQSSNPVKEGGEIVGIFTGKREAAVGGLMMLQVSWTNTWWQDGEWKIWIPFSQPKKGEWKNENLVSWVKETEVEWKGEFVDKETLQTAKIDYDPETESSSLSSTTIILLALGLAFFLRKKKGRR